MYKRIAAIITIVIILVGVTFGLSYYIGRGKLNNSSSTSKRNNIPNANDKDITTIQTKSNEKVKANSKIIFITKYYNSDLIVTDSTDTSNSYEGKTKDEMEKIFEKEGYIVDSITDTQVTLVRELQRYKYEPNKYVLGVKEDILIIYKTDENGVLIVDENTNIKIRSSDSKRIDIGGPEFQYETKEDALDGSSAYR